ncbi:hypothetical protein JL721_509 [Aureococcus anophagefferens]|nr:hypothetical protein JL721_509 [Aureococcus anophagefferens]
MGAKDALCKIANMGCGLVDTFALRRGDPRDPVQEDDGSSRVVKQNRGSAGEGIWLCWIANETKDGIIPDIEYRRRRSGRVAGDYAMLKLMEMNDNHVEYHTVKEFLVFCAVCGGDKTLADVPDADYYEACKLTDLMGIKALEMLDTAAAPKVRYNTLLPSPAGAKYSLAVVQFKATIEKYDALIVRINPGQLSQIPGADGAQAKFDATMNAFAGKGKPNRGSAGEGIWLCWIANETKDGIIPDIDYPSKTLGPSRRRRRHAQAHGDERQPRRVPHGEGVPRVLRRRPERRRRRHVDVDVPGEYLKGGAAGGQLVDQLLPRISEGEVRVLMAGDTCQMIIHKKPEGGLSAVGGNSAYTHTSRRTAYADLLTKLTTDIKNGLMDVLDLKGEALPLLWTCDYIPKNPEGWSKTENARDMETEYAVGEFNCSCVGVSMFQAVCGGDKTLADVPDADYYEACKLTDLMGIKAPRCSTRRAPKVRYNTLLPSPAGAKYSLAVVQPAERATLLYDYTDHAGFEATIEKYDALIVRINPGQLRVVKQNRGSAGEGIWLCWIANETKDGIIPTSSTRRRRSGRVAGDDAMLKLMEMNDNHVEYHTVKEFLVFCAVCGGDKTLADVPDADYYEACKLTDLMGIKAPRCSTRPRPKVRYHAAAAAGGPAGCDMLLYDYTDHAGFEATIEKYDALIVRINPGQLSQIPGADGAQAKFDATMNALAGKGKPVWSSPGVQQKMGAKDALCKIANMGCGLFKKTMAFQPRVVKQNRGSAGEGIWLCWIANETKDGIIPDIEYPSKTFGAESLGDDVMLKLMEMNDNHVEYHTVKEFLVFCMIIHKKPEGGLSAVGGNSAYTYYEPSDPLYADLLTKLTTDIKNGLMDVLDLKGEALPLLWTCDYIPKNPEGWSKTENACDMETEYVVGEFNCSCVGVSMFQAVCGGDKTLADVPDADYYEACKLTDLMGIKAPRCSTRRGAQGPRPPERRLGQGPGRNRIDSIPIANGVIKAGGACDMLLYDYTDHAGFEATIEKYDALIVRINPGQLSQIPGADGAQAKFDATMNAFVGKGKPVWSSPGVQQKMGAKDALCKIANMGCGLVDTRVVKQNRGSAGEGIWLCWIANETKDGIIRTSSTRRRRSGRVAGDDAMLKLMEMNDNHVEYHTVKEFLVFCVDGPSGAGAGTWTSTFPGEYLKGGAAAGGQLVDQRLLPRISEGEVRVLMAGDTCQMIIHKKPEGGLSAVGGNSAYAHEPSDPLTRTS